jgi:hypothetical protein
MPTFKEFLGIKPKAEAEKEPEPMEEVARKEREAARQAKLEEAKRKFVVEKPKLEKRLSEIPAEIEDFKRRLEISRGPDMRKILDKEYELNAALSPVDATDPNRRREYEDWASALKDSRAVTQEMKAHLGRQIDEYSKKISDLENEKRKIEERFQQDQRGY